MISFSENIITKSSIKLKLNLTLKAPRKNASEKLRLLKLLAANNCLTLLTNFEPAAPWSQVKHSTTEPLRSHQYCVISQTAADVLLVAHIANIMDPDQTAP